jgi:hypothetical protein
MQARVYTPSAQFSGDHSLLVLGVGNLGARVVDILRQEFDRLQVSGDRHRLIVWNPNDQSNEGNNRAATFDAADHLQDPRHESLREQLTHLELAHVVEDAAGKQELAATSYIALHHDQSHALLTSIQADVDALRHSNPENLLRMLVIGNLAEACVAGSLTGMLVLLRPHAQVRKVDLEAWVTTGDGATGDTARQLQADLQSASSVQQCKHVVLGEDSWTIPGTHGLREDRVETGRWTC